MAAPLIIENFQVPFVADYQLIILGAGPAGLAAAMYASRARIDSLLLEKLGPGGQVLVTDWVENYLGFPEGISGVDLIEKMAAHTRLFGVAERNGEVTAIEKRGEELALHVAGGETLTARALIVATGARPNRLDIPGEEALTGKGVSYCATCDGPFFRDRVVAVVGGGDTAVQEASFLARFASKVYLIHRRDQLRAVRVLQERARNNPKIEPIWETVVERIEGEDAVRSVMLRHRTSGESRSLPVDGVFIFVGIRPNTAFLKGVVDQDEWGFVLTDTEMRTSVTGIFAAGDCRAKLLRQIITAAGDGATAAYAAEQMLEG
jgi:thioredoxin reductase (NADPH)